MRHIFRSKKGVAIEWAIVFGLVIFGLIALLLIGMSSFRNSISISDIKSQQRFDLDQLGEYFIRAISSSGEFPTGDEDNKNDFNKDGFLWMDSEAIEFFLEANKNYRYTVKKLIKNITGREGFLTFYSEKGCSAKLEVINKKNDGTELVIAVEEDYDYDVSGLLFRNPILFRDLDGTGTVYHIIEWTVNDQYAQSGSKLNGLQQLWGWIGGLFGNRGEGASDTWSITYELNGGKGTGYATCQKGGSVTLPQPIRQGYGFLGWYDAKGKSVGLSGSSYKPSRSVKLYAKWEPYTVTFDASSNGGACDVLSVEGYVESLPAATIADEFKEFVGWYTEKEGGSRVGIAGDDFNPTSNVTLYAQFETVKFSIIKFVVNGNTVHQKTLDEATLFNLQDDTAQAIDGGVLGLMKGYRFAGWKNDVDGKIYAGDEMLNVEKRGTIVMTAQWAGYTVTYDAGEGGKVTGSGYTTAYNGGTWNWPGATKSGYVLTGWMIGGKTYKLTDKTYVPLEDTTAKAVWQENSCTFVFVCDGIKVAEKKVFFSESYTLDVPDQEMAGCRFDGWTLNKILYTAGDEVKAAGVDMSGEITLTATFTPWAIHFDVGTYGEGTLADMSGIITVPAAPAAKKDADGFERYYFIVWKDQNGQQYAPGTTLTPTEETTLTAQWSENPLVVLQYHLNGDGASVVGGWNTVVLCEPGTNVTLPTKTDVSRKGYEFNGWYLTPECDGDQVTSVTVTADTHLYAKWTENENDATFDANGGKVKDASGHELDKLIMTLCYTDAEFTPAEQPKRAGYLFMGWCTDKNGDGELLAAGAAIKAANTDPVIVVYYAIWQPIKVTLNANGGTLTGSDALTYSDTMLSELKAKTVNRLGFAFVGWYTAEEGGERVDDKSSWYPISENTILWAHWTPYTITLKANGGSFSGNTTVNYYDGYILPVPTRTGYKFSGWTDGTTKVYSTTAKIDPPSGDITLTAQWTGYTITLDAKGGTISGDTKVNYYDGYVLPTASRPGYTFNGWKSSADDSIHAAGSKINAPDGDVTMTAQWAMATYTIKFDYNGGSKKNQDYSSLTGLTIDSTKKLDKNEYRNFGTKYHISFTDYTFNGWNTKADATGHHYDDGASVKEIISDASGTTITLYAEWTYTVSFKANANDGSGTMGKQTFYYNQTQSLNKCTFNRKDYHFKGWTTSSSQTAQLAYNDGQSSGTDKFESTLYAMWDMNSFTVYFEDQNGKSLGHQRINAGVSTELTDYSKLEEPGKTLTWIDEKNVKEYKNKESINLSIEHNGEIHLKAQLKSENYTLKLSLSNATASVTCNGKTISGNNQKISDVQYGALVTVEFGGFTGDNSKTFTVPGGKYYTDEACTKEPTSLNPGNKYYFKIPDATDGDTLTVTCSSEQSSCVASGTLITLADGTKKPVEDITLDDKILVFNHETGTVEAASINFIENDGMAVYEIINLVWSNGVTSRIISEHGFFDLDLMEYVYIHADDAEEYIGHRFYEGTYGADGYTAGEVTLTDVYLTTEYTGCYSFPSVYHLNFFMEDMLSMPGGIDGMFNIFTYGADLRYDEELMRRDLEEFGLFDYAEVADYMSYETFMTYPAQYINVSIGKGLMTEEQLMFLIERYAIPYAADN